MIKNRFKRAVPKALQFNCAWSCHGLEPMVSKSGVPMTLGDEGIPSQTPPPGEQFLYLPFPHLPIVLGEGD
jgi:hypothetical protein